MADTIINEPMLDMYTFETNHLIEQMEELILHGEKSNQFLLSIDESFRIMHTIKGSSAMMLFNNISELSHVVEDLFYYLRENEPEQVDYQALSDIVLESVDFIKNELSKIEKSCPADGDAKEIIDGIKQFLINLKELNGDCYISKKDNSISQPAMHKPFINSVKETDLSDKRKYEVVIFFEDGCEMENIRAFSIIHMLSDITSDLSYYPENIIDDDTTIEQIKKEGFKISFKTLTSIESIRELLENTVSVKNLELSAQNDIVNMIEAQNDNSSQCQTNLLKQELITNKELSVQNHLHSTKNQGMISVNLSKTDRLMDLIGELVIAEAMVTQNPDLKGLELNNFDKSVRQLHKITDELQDVVMSIRMVPLSTIFYKMHRIVRDMCKKLDKEVKFEMIGEETEVDKNIIDHISDPLMHLIRNAIDHGIESKEDRLLKGKPQEGRIILEARHAGSDVLITVKDDGRGLNKRKIIDKAKKKGLLYKPEEEMSISEIYNLILLPGFSTCENITEFSGRGVGMDVVVRNIETIGGTVSINSTEDLGTTVTFKIPLTLAIVDGMNVCVGKSRYTIPTTSIKESFRANLADIICDPDGNEMIMVRGQCHPILRIHEFYRIKTDVIRLDEGIVIMLEHEEKKLCIFVDQLLGQQQVVVKALPSYIKQRKKIVGLSGCTILGDGNISLILDIEGLLKGNIN
ncbi:chemotaxis protein CheA [Lacrimispora amygdalina]|uniref:Chemotaxis protein CheA n=1 Tax=Lacrimispora amygdalina TaxID=253257 RepID=A0A3E2NHU8_9FIRM|nr:chemotaxis protein CheA [Clostridium indicum]RFZ80569.1 chemotaxis protein CheA [Clostridium indicum]